MTLEMIERDLNTLKPFLKPQMITIVGGEPTLHPKLVEIIKLVKQIRIDDRCMVITNGKLLPKMKEEFLEGAGDIENLHLWHYGPSRD